MPPIRTMMSCPQCRQPVQVELEQLFDVTQDPNAKRRFLNGQFNLINCPNCRYQGQASTFLLYHDNDKELLMSYVPMTLGLPQAEQEKIIGKLVTEVVNKLPQEKRKGYLFNPKPALTIQNMMDRILEADGVTKDMMDAQRGKANLLQSLLNTPDEQLEAKIKEHDAELDEITLQMLSASIQATAQGGNVAAARKMADLQNQIIAHSSYGAKLRDQQAQMQAAMREMQELGDQLTPNKIMEMILTADSDEKLAVYVSLGRPLLDYGFFESLTRRIDRAASPDKERLTQLRDKVLSMTQQMDEAAKARVQAAAEVLKRLMDAPNLNQAIAENAEAIDDTFMAVLTENLNAARQANRLDVAAKLARVNETINQLMEQSAPPEVKFINQLLEMKTDAEAEAEMFRRPAEMTPEFLQTLTYLAEQMRQGKREDLATRLDHLYEAALSAQMTANWKSNQ